MIRKIAKAWGAKRPMTVYIVSSTRARLLLIPLQGGFYDAQANDSVPFTAPAGGMRDDGPRDQRQPAHHADVANGRDQRSWQKCLRDDPRAIRSAGDHVDRAVMVYILRR